MSMAEAISIASKKAILRDAEAVRRHSPDLATVAEQERRANESRFTIVKLRDKNKASFTQILQENYHVLQHAELLSTSERALLLDLVPFVEFNSNFIVIDHKVVTISQLAKALNYDTKWLSKLINSLIRKGIIYEIADVEQIKEWGHVVTERPLILNPEIIIASDKNSINLTLCRIHLLYEKLEKKHNIKLQWKIWFTPDHKYGRLYRRETWLKKVKEAKNTKASA